MKDGRTLYLVKWRELTYDQATWEEDNDEIIGLKAAIEYYMDLRNASLGGGSSKSKKGKGKKPKARELLDDDERSM